MVRVVGIDPGIEGAVALVSDNGFGDRDLLDVIDLPVMGESSKREIDCASLYRWLVAAAATNAVIENVTAMPSIPDEHGVRRGMGAASAFRFGMGVGALRAAVAIAGIPTRLVTPASWKKFYALRGPDKEPSRQLAIRTFPTKSQWFERKKDHQRAEAALLALWGAKTGL